MSLASKFITKDKKFDKEPQNAAQKPFGPVSAGSSIPASAYNPLLGTFHTVEFSTISAASPHHSNSRFPNMDERDELSGTSLNSVAECDSVSNNGSWSGESEDHKDKTSNSSSRIETIPGADNYKREKIRQKNEKKHQRQKEKRAQELHDRCNGYLMSRKLEALAQQLVAMGFSQERATMSLILNEGRLEESVAWLFEGGEESDQSRNQNLGMVNLKIDVSEELARVAEMESKYMCSKQEVERAIIACEGDLEKAGENLRLLKLDPPPSPPKQEETGDPPVIGNDKIFGSSSSNTRKAKPNFPTILERNDEIDSSCLKAAVIERSSDSTCGNVQSAKRSQPKFEWEKSDQVSMPIEKKWLSTGSNASVSCSSLSQSTLWVSSPSTMSETQYIAIGTDFKNLPSGTVREPVTMMQRPQALSTKYVSTSNTCLPPGANTSWYSADDIVTLKCNGIFPSIATTGNHNSFNLTPNQMYYQLERRQQQHSAIDVSQGDSPGFSKGNGSWSRASPTPALAAATSLGLFPVSGSAGSSGPSSPVDWKTGGSIHHLDYNNVDWSLNRESSSSSPSKFCLAKSSILKNSGQVYNFNASHIGCQPTVRPAISNLNRDSITGLKDGVVSLEALAANYREWTSAFEGKDLFSLSRQFVYSPTQ